MTLSSYAYCLVWAALLATSSNCLARPVDAASDYRKGLVFLVATGGPDACGKGCGQWIAVEGSFTPGSSERFREFLSSADRRSLPVFLHSIGGARGEGVRVGRILREFNMTASVGRTVVKECIATTLASDRCAKAVRSREPTAARLETGFCNSACVFALAGGSLRKIPNDAHIGIHSPGSLPDGTRLTKSGLLEEFRVVKRYLVDMGIDARLMDAAAKIPNERMQRLSRDEIARYGIETRTFETSWFVDRPKGGRVQAVKAWTYSVEQGGSRFTTITLRVGCIGDNQISMVVKRPLVGGEVEIDLGEKVHGLRGLITVGNDQTISNYFAWDDFQRALFRGTMKLSIKPLERGDVQTVPLSATDLVSAMPEIRKRCS